MSRKRNLRGALAGGVLAGAGLCAPASATWSIILIDTGTGEVAIGSATCLVGFDLQANTPVLLTGIGGAAAQSAVDSTGQNRVFIRDQLLLGTPPNQILTMLSTFDSAHQSRQYGIADTWGTGHVATFTGSGDGQWAGGQIGRIVGAGANGGDILFAVQGNVLTGAPVVAAAVGQIMTGPGDLPDRLMRAMEAAASFGGDGRCSCSPSNPTGCGSPPFEFRRSAYIAYMLDARAGDRDGCNGIYRVGAAPAAVFVADLNQDGRPDLLTANGNASTVSVSRNTTSRGVPTFASVPLSFGVGVTPRDVAGANLTADSFPDVVVANFANDNVSVLRGQGNGLLLPRVNYPAGDGPIALALADFNGDGTIDVAVANNLSGNVSILPNDGTATLGAGITVAVGSGPGAIDAGDIDDDGDIDLVVGLTTANAVVVLRNTTPPGGPLSFTADPPISAGRGVNGVKIARLNDDTLADIAVSAPTDNAVNILIQNAGGAGFTMSSIVLGTAFPSPNGIAVGDVSGDGVPDLVTASRGGTNSRLVVLIGRGDGTFQPPAGYLIGTSPGRPVLADVDGDGDLDAVFTVSSNTAAMVVENLGGGVFNNGIGCATGDYFMDFNVTTSDPNADDPVPILRSRFDVWRAQHVGHPDATRSTAVLDRSGIPGNGTSTATMTITLRDFTGAPITAPITSVTVAHAPDSDGLCAIGDAVDGGNGVFTVTLTAGHGLGVDAFIVRADNGVRPVVLMPEVRLSLTVDADWNHDGTINSDDFFAFVSDFLNGNADANGDGISNSQDFFDFVNAFFGG